MTNSEKPKSGPWGSKAFEDGWMRFWDERKRNIQLIIDVMQEEGQA